jgi:hypothetical protein
MARPKKNQVTEQAAASAPTEVVEINNETLNTAETVTPETQKTSENSAPPILPEIDRVEMDRYFCVINTSNQASRIMQAVSHQRDLEMWGVHQYDDNRSRNSYARSFYFKNRENAVKALEHASKLLSQ